MLCFLSIIFGVLAMSCRAQNLPENICSDYFEYVQDGGIWYGEITLSSLDLGTHYIDVRFTQRGQPLNNDVGYLSPHPDLKTARESMGRNRPIIFRLRLNPHQNILPKLSKFALNGQILCRSEEYPDYNWSRYYNITEIRTRTSFIQTSGNNIIRNNVVRDYDVCCQTVEQIAIYRNGDISAQNTPNLNRLPQWPQLQTQRPAPALRYPLPVPVPRTSPAPASTITAATSSSVPTQVESRNFECGVENSVVPFIYKGESLEQGRFPWLTAIYHRMGTATDFKCSGSLISTKVVITAAHCVIGKLSIEVFAWVGRYDLHSPSEGGVHEIDSIQTHPDYNQRAISDADVAVLTFILPVVFTRNVRPICIWAANEPIALRRKEKGYVAGWGQDDKGNEMTRYPQVVDAELVSESECRKKMDFQEFITSRTLCAGNLDGSGPCSGDSGGGLMIERDGRWLLRGVVSLGQKKMSKCDHSQYVIYCDLAKHIDWVQRKLI